MIEDLGGLSVLFVCFYLHYVRKHVFQLKNCDTFPVFAQHRLWADQHLCFARAKSKTRFLITCIYIYIYMGGPRGRVGKFAEFQRS